jgi:hypothetical protein
MKAWATNKTMPMNQPTVSVTSSCKGISSEKVNAQEFQSSEQSAPWAFWFEFSRGGTHPSGTPHLS